MAQVLRLRERLSDAGENVSHLLSDAMEAARRQNIFTYALLAIGSFAAGLLLGFLLAPLSGSETRSWIRNRMTFQRAPRAEAASVQVEEEGPEAELLA